MKKSLTRVLSLVLVLVMMLGVLPMASADTKPTNEAGGTIEVTAPTGLVAGGSAGQITITKFHGNDPDGEGPGGAWDVTGAELNSLQVSYSIKSGNEFVDVSNTGSVTPKKAGTAKIEVTATFIGNLKTTARKEISVTVAAGLEISASKTTLVLGETATLSATNGGTSVSATNIYSYTGDVVELDGNKVTAKKPGTAKITATYDGKNAEVSIEVKAPTATITPAMLELSPNENKSLTVSYEYLPAGKTASDVAVTWTPTTGNDYIQVTPTSGNDESATVKGLKKTTTDQTVTAAFTLDGYTIASAKCTVKVKDKAVISCNSESAAVGETVTLTPKLTLNGTAVSAKFKFTVTGASDSSTDTDKEYVNVKRSTAGYVEVKIEVESYKVDGTTITDTTGIEDLTAKVSFYDSSAVDVTLISGKTDFDFDDEEIFSNVVINDSNKPLLVDNSMVELLYTAMTSSVTANAKSLAVSGSTSSTAVGSISGASNWSLLSKAQFLQNGSRTGTASFKFTVKDEDGLTIHTCNVKITIAGGEGDVHYETTYNKAITVDASDFQKFWNDLDLTYNRKLEYVQFNITSSVGTLYVDSTKKRVVTSAMKFYLDPSSDQYDLDDVYYVPLSTKTTEYIDAFNFTAVSNYSEKYDGTMTIGLNTSNGSSITSRGIVFGSTYAKEIAEAYNTNTGKTLGYVVFELPKANEGTLYSALTVSGKNYKVADSAQLKATEKLWYTGSSSRLDLADAAFIPAAGFSGKVVLSYTAYDNNGNNAYAGVLRLNVTTKTASAVFSDITAKSYGWAADSVDFLYYEGTAQGSNGKYNPASNITRRDFMLMLYRAFLEEDYGTYNVSSNFPDVKLGTDDYSKEIYQAVGVAKYLGIAQGTNNMFNPTANITRQEAMVLIYRTLEVIDKELRTSSGIKATSFKDYSKIGSWAATAISSLVSHGVIQGTNDYINPLSNITRAEMACILHRVITY